MLYLFPSFSLNSFGELRDVGDSGRLKCLHGKVDTTISCVCTCTVGSSQCPGCMVYGPCAMTACHDLSIVIYISVDSFALI